METRSEPISSQILAANVALTRAENEYLPVCKSMRKPKSYSFMWNKTKLVMNEPEAKETAKQVALGVLNGKRIKGYTFFNECKSKYKRFKTNVKLIKIGKLCFY
jgi:spore germination cell wall hydrolase CwlJ-like protein